MKKNILTLALIVLTNLVSINTASAERMSAEALGQIMVLSNIDTNKRILSLSGMEMRYTSSTNIFDRNGNKMLISELKKGQYLLFSFDPNERYISYPTLTHIWIKS